MSSAKLVLALACCVVVGIPSAVHAAPAADAMTEIAAQGTTRLFSGSRNGMVAIDLVTRAATGPENQPDHVTRCSGGRVTCALVDKLAISVGGEQIAVPQRAVVLLADVSWGKIMSLAKGRFELLLECGDAAAAYEARIFFDKRLVSRLELWAGEAGMLQQATTYKDLSNAFR